MKENYKTDKIIRNIILQSLNETPIIRDDDLDKFTQEQDIKKRVNDLKYSILHTIIGYNTPSFVKNGIKDFFKDMGDTDIRYSYDRGNDTFELKPINWPIRFSIIMKQGIAGEPYTIILPPAARLFFYFYKGPNHDYQIDVQMQYWYFVEDNVPSDLIKYFPKDPLELMKSINILPDGYTRYPAKLTYPADSEIIKKLEKIKDYLIHYQSGK